MGKCAFSCIAGKSGIMYLSLKMHISFDPAIILLEIFPKEISHVKNTYAEMFITLFIIEKSW